MFLPGVQAAREKGGLVLAHESAMVAPDTVSPSAALGGDRTVVLSTHLWLALRNPLPLLSRWQHLVANTFETKVAIFLLRCYHLRKALTGARDRSVPSAEYFRLVSFKGLESSRKG